MADRFVGSLIACLVGLVATFPGCAPRPVEPTGHILLQNADFERWTGHGPTGWGVAEGTVARGEVSRVRLAHSHGLRLRASDHRWDGKWHLTQIQQTVSSSNGRVALKLMPETDYVGDAFARSVVGLELVDAAGHQRFYVINSRLSQPRVYHRPGVTVYAYPGRLHAWNTVKVSVVEEPRDDFVAAPTAHMRFQLIAANMDDAFVTSRAAGTFGPIETH